jgi:hypothetical protein
VEVPSALWRKARTGELQDAAAGILISAFELDFHGDPDSHPRFTIISLTEPVLTRAAREAARDAPPVARALRSRPKQRDQTATDSYCEAPPGA